MSCIQTGTLNYQAEEHNFFVSEHGRFPSGRSVDRVCIEAFLPGYNDHLKHRRLEPGQRRVLNPDCLPCVFAFPGAGCV